MASLAPPSTSTEDTYANSSNINAQAESELDALISAYASPVPSQVLIDYDNNARKRHVHGMDNESALEHLELKGPVFREFTIHIFQSIYIMQIIPPTQPEDIESRMVDLPLTKKGVKKMIILDLDETLAHCVRQKEPTRPPDVMLDFTTMSGLKTKIGFNIRPYTKECLEMLNQYFEVVVFTASNKNYADLILDYIDPTNTLI